MVVDLHYPFIKRNVGALSRGPRELRERVGRAEALSVSNSPSEFCALQLPNARILRKLRISRIYKFLKFSKFSKIALDVIKVRIKKVFDNKRIIILTN